MDDGITLRLSSVELATLQLSLERYANDLRTVEESTAAERQIYQDEAAKIAQNLRTLPQQGDNDVIFTGNHRLIVMAALTSRIYGCRDAAWRAESHGDLKLGTEWRTAALRLEEIMQRLGGRDVVPIAPDDVPIVFPEEAEIEEAPTGPGTLHGSWPG